MKKMINDVKSAGSQADVVIVSTHWGVHFIPAVIADYEKEIAHMAIDAGAALIVGSLPGPSLNYCKPGINDSKR
jgi:poly-gamma-glutamate capsule biosynthesis protein CapA/YwtB (metallophosphatase superfamily)